MHIKYILLEESEIFQNFNLIYYKKEFSRHRNLNYL